MVTDTIQINIIIQNMIVREEEVVEEEEVVVPVGAQAVPSRFS